MQLFKIAKILIDQKIQVRKTILLFCQGTNFKIYNGLDRIDWFQFDKIG